MRRVRRIASTLLTAAIVSVFALSAPASAAGGLVGYWNFDETSGTATADSSGNGNNGTFIGTGATRSTVLPPTSCFVNVRSLQVDGSGDYVEIPDSPSMDPADEITIAFWMNPDTVSNGYQHIVFKQGPVVTSYGVWLNGANVYMEDNDNSVRSLSSNAALSVGDWHYIAVTYDGNIQSLYIDGVLDNSQSLPGITLSYQNSPIKVGTGDYNNPFAGYIDDLRIYDRALTAGEVADLSAGGCGPGVASNIAVSPSPSPSSESAILAPNTGIGREVETPSYLHAALCILSLLAAGIVGVAYRRINS